MVSLHRLADLLDLKLTTGNSRQETERLIMASIIKEPNGRKTIQVTLADRKRPKIRLGKTSRKSAEAFKVKVEHLVSARITGYPIDDE